MSGWRFRIKPQKGGRGGGDGGTKYNEWNGDNKKFHFHRVRKMIENELNMYVNKDYCEKLIIHPKIMSLK